MAEITLRENPTESRYEALAGEAVVSTADYVLQGEVLEIPHTWTDPERRGEGIAGRLVNHVLTEAREKGYTVVPTCPYVARYVEEHDEFADLVRGH